MRNGYWWVWWRTDAARGEIGESQWFLVEVRNGHAKFVHHPKTKITTALIMRDDVPIKKVTEEELDKHRQHPENLEPPKFGAYEHTRYMTWEHMG